MGLAPQTRRQWQPAPLLPVASHLMGAGQVVRGHKEQPTVTAATLRSLGAPDWLTPALHPHGNHRVG